LKDISAGYFYTKLDGKKEQFPMSGQLELTYRCNYDCVHCYCKGSEDKGRELTTEEWKKVLDIISAEGCMFITFTGGDPLVREDFLEIYDYAKRKGFIITIFTNAYGLSDEVIGHLMQSPPFSVEVTVNGVTDATYESITCVKGSFKQALANLRKLKDAKVRLILKSNCLTLNKHEVAKVKKWTEEFLGKPAKKRYYFKYDPMIYPRLNGDKSPCDYRLSFDEIDQLKKEDPDIWEEYKRSLNCDMPELGRERNFLYRCNSWFKQFFIDPFGRLKFCAFSDKCSVDLKRTPFKTGFYDVFPQVLLERFKTASRCMECPVRAVCYHCPGRAFLETGDEEAPVDYYCMLAHETSRRLKKPRGKAKAMVKSG